ncbi:uncharacterized protein [Argopecten irradians]|uniref:uncharacterized protein n=1 Tax=Argopecten irradians TaxID=31199 RepID=UPI00371D2171
MSAHRIQNELLTLRHDNEIMKNTIEDQQCRGMKYNLVLTGLLEQRDEIIAEKVRGFFRHELGIHKRMEFANVHRFNRPGKHRPIVVRFLHFDDKQEVKRRGYLLKGKRFGISEQFPDSVEERRKRLYPVMKHHRSAGHHVSLVRDRLYIDGQLYQSETTGNTVNRDTEPQPTYSEAAQGSSTPNNTQATKRRLSTPNSGNDRRPASRARIAPLEDADGSFTHQNPQRQGRENDRQHTSGSGADGRRA